MLIWFWIRRGCKGRLGILKWGILFPHFAIFDEYVVYHYKADDPYLPWFQKLWYSGEIVIEFNKNKKR